MSAKIIVFENNSERAMMSADMYHDWNNQRSIFGTETQKLLKLCEKLFHVALHSQDKELEMKLLKKINGIAKTHAVYIRWYGMGLGTYEPDKFLVSEKGIRLALIQC